MPIKCSASPKLLLNKSASKNKFYYNSNLEKLKTLDKEIRWKFSKAGVQAVQQ